MFRFIHSADWQLGARFAQFGAKGAALRAARLQTLRRALELARSRAVDAFIVARDLPAGAAAIGVTHGAPAIEGKHQPNDFPIALDAASRAGLAYLAIGHWHNWLADLDGGRIVMPGTPEPDRFDHERCGFVSLV